MERRAFIGSIAASSAAVALGESPRDGAQVVWGEDLMELTFAGPTIAGIEGY
ncbi:MAG TPA: hypothetical protein VLE53_02130 [Gemmatimonadaceae bacterium]|nr:hypothetical protein [Gemmatimonadaceae bacterium]